MSQSPISGKQKEQLIYEHLSPETKPLSQIKLELSMSRSPRSPAIPRGKLIKTGSVSPRKFKDKKEELVSWMEERDMLIGKKNQEIIRLKRANDKFFECIKLMNQELNHNIQKAKMRPMSSIPEEFISDVISETKKQGVLESLRSMRKSMGRDCRYLKRKLAVNTGHQRIVELEQQVIEARNTHSQLLRSLKEVSLSIQRNQRILDKWEHQRIKIALEKDEACGCTREEAALLTLLSAEMKKTGTLQEKMEAISGNDQARTQRITNTSRKIQLFYKNHPEISNSEVKDEENCYPYSQEAEKISHFLSEARKENEQLQEELAEQRVIGKQKIEVATMQAREMRKIDAQMQMESRVSQLQVSGLLRASIAQQMAAAVSKKTEKSCLIQRREGSPLFSSVSTGAGLSKRKGPRLIITKEPEPTQETRQGKAYSSVTPKCSAIRRLASEELNSSCFITQTIPSDNLSLDTSQQPNSSRPNIRNSRMNIDRNALCTHRRHGTSNNLKTLDRTMNLQLYKLRPRGPAPFQFLESRMERKCRNKSIKESRSLLSRSSRYSLNQSGAFPSISTRAEE